MTHLTKLGTSLPDCSPESELLPELVVPASDSPPPRRRRLKSRSLLNNTSRTDTGSLSRGFSWVLARGTWNLKGLVFILDFNAFSGTGTHKSTAPGAVRPEGALPYSSQDLTKKQQSWSSRVPLIIKGHFKLPGMVPQEKKFIGAATEFCSKAYTCALARMAGNPAICKHTGTAIQKKPHPRASLIRVKTPDRSTPRRSGAGIIGPWSGSCRPRFPRTLMYCSTQLPSTTPTAGATKGKLFCGLQLPLR